MRSVATRAKKLYMIIFMALAMAFTAPALNIMPGVTSVQAATKKPKLSKSKLTLTVGGTARLKVKNTRKKVKWSTSNKKVAKVSKNGTVYAKKAGKATITAKVAGRKLKCRVVVKKAAVANTTRINTYRLDGNTSWDGITVAATVTNNTMSITIHNGRSNPISMGWAGSPFYVGVTTGSGSYTINEDVLQSLWNSGDTSYQFIQPGQSSTYTCTRDFSVRPTSVILYNISPLNQSGLPVFDWDSFSYVKYNLQVRF